MMLDVKLKITGKYYSTTSVKNSLKLYTNKHFIDFVEKKLHLHLIPLFSSKLCSCTHKNI